MTVRNPCPNLWPCPEGVWPPSGQRAEGVSERDPLRTVNGGRNPRKYGAARFSGMTIARVWGRNTP